MEKSISNMINISKHLSKVLNKAVEKAFPIKDFQSVVTWSSTGTSDLSSPSAISIYNKNNKREGWTFPSVKEVAQEIVDNLEQNSVVKEIKITQLIQSLNNTKDKKSNINDKNKDNKKQKKQDPPASYYIDFTINDNYLIDTAMNLLKNGIHPNVDEHKCKRVLCDFSSPNIAKEMHVGHLRSSIIGESICRVLEFLSFDVLRINHVGDWGTQFGMLIANLKEEFPDYLNNKPEIKELEFFYVQSKKKFDKDPEFKSKAYSETVKLQTGDSESREAWKFICQVSRNEYEKIYKRLNITLKEIGESFYDPLARELIPKLEKEKVLEKDKGATIMRLQNMKNPLMIVKSDGGYTYDTSDLAAIIYRIVDQNRNWLIYCVGAEQSEHFKMIFQAAKQLGYHNPPSTRVDHMAFGMMLNENGGKIATREGGLVKLSDLLDKAKEEAKKELKKRYGDESKTNKEENNSLTDNNQKKDLCFNEEELEINAEKIGYSAVKYFDLKQTRENNYKFSYELMLDPKGNTAVYLFYNYVRICSVFRKLNIQSADINNLINKHNIIITHKKERELLIALLKFNDIIDEVITNLALNKLADYTYSIATKFSEFFDECRIKDSEHINSRLLLIKLTQNFMELSFNLLGLTPVERI